MSRQYFNLNLFGQCVHERKTCTSHNFSSRQLEISSLVFLFLSCFMIICNQDVFWAVSCPFLNLLPFSEKASEGV